MRILGVARAGVLALTVPIAAHAVALGSNLGAAKAGAALGIVKVAGGCGPGWHPVPGHWSRWRGEWVPPHCAPNHNGGDWGDSYPGRAKPYDWGAYNGGQYPYGGRYNYGPGRGNP
jgi:hypothetical protein